MLITLPYPPSLNSYYRTANGRILISAKGREYRKHVAVYLMAHGLVSFGKARLSVEIAAYMPDKRRRDLDNLFKCVLDSLQHCGIYDDDSQIDKLSIIRDGQCKGGKLIIDILEIINRPTKQLKQ